MFKYHDVTYTVVSRYYDTVGIRKKYHIIQTIVMLCSSWDIDLVS